MHPSPAATFEQRLADAIAALDLGELLALDTMLEAIENPFEGVAALSVFLSRAGSASEWVYHAQGFASGR